nr:hypothetical protein CFP56_56987 [Quercus suber]
MACADSYGLATTRRTQGSQRDHAKAPTHSRFMSMSAGHSSNDRIASRNHSGPLQSEDHSHSQMVSVSTHLMTLTKGLKSPPSTHSSPSPPRPCPHPSPTSPTTFPGRPATTLPGGIIIYGGTTVPGRILQWSRTVQKFCNTQPAPIHTLDEIEAADTWLPGPMKTLSPILRG